MTAARLWIRCNGKTFDFQCGSGNISCRVAITHFTGVSMHALRGTRLASAGPSAWGHPWRDAMKPIHLNPNGAKRGWNYFYDPDHILTDADVSQIVRNGHDGLVVLPVDREERMRPAFVDVGRYLYRVPASLLDRFTHCRLEMDRCFVVDIRQDRRRELVWKCLLEQVRAVEEGDLYCIRCGEYYKIGITIDSERRFRRYVTENPFPLRVVFSDPIVGYREVESILKRTFAPKRVRGEWFSLNADDLRALHDIVGSEFFRAEYIDQIVRMRWTMKDRSRLAVGSPPSRALP